MDGVQLPQGYSHFEEGVYFLPFSSQKFLVNKFFVLNLVSQKTTGYPIDYNYVRLILVAWDHSFSTFAKFSEKLTVLTP